MNDSNPGLGPVMFNLEGQTITEEEQAFLRHPATGGVILFSRNFESRQQMSELIQQIRHIAGRTLLIAVDQEGGRVQRFKQGFVALPEVRQLGEYYEADAQVAEQIASAIGWIMAAELLTLGVDFSFAPVLDLDHGLSEVIGSRAFHSQPEVVSQLALAYVDGMHAAGMAAVAKHFPGHGGVTADSHHELPFDQRGVEDIRRQDMQPFVDLAHAGIEAMMSAHVVYPLDPGMPASLSKPWLTGVLRDEIGFNGALFSDDLSMAAVDIVEDIVERAELALDAGSDQILICNQPKSVERVLDALVNYQQPAVSKHRLWEMKADNAALGTIEQVQHSEDWKIAMQLLRLLEPQIVE